METMVVALVIGCAGFIGSQIADACQDKGDEVRGVDLMTDYDDESQRPTRLAGLLDHDRFEFHRVDLTGGRDEDLADEAARRSCELAPAICQMFVQS